MNAAEIAYAQISLQCQMPLSYLEAFDEACGYRSQVQATVISRAIQDGNAPALLAMMTELYAAAILRNEELADIGRNEANERADRQRLLRKDMVQA